MTIAPNVAARIVIVSHVRTSPIRLGNARKSRSMRDSARPPNADSAKHYRAVCAVPERNSNRPFDSLADARAATLSGEFNVSQSLGRQEPVRLAGSSHPML
jgi:hypothetical protein